MMEKRATAGFMVARSSGMMLAVDVLACIRTNNPSELRPA
ncbi:hypothetical protein SAMN05192556_108125 [Halomonas caseinilytica]|uniref:Uncharacterized protein n=1 Tax=Halomonas caseinilytica TaxID=438744 RepID=A0A1M6YBW2_9GAMM|nr:hypothetical protein SAMN04487952_12225 [Halomonas caseinilytica]SHL15670.1 hypothetical protein SAMN05192556_108125 [Halomonas caseinilytica]